MEDAVIQNDAIELAEDFTDWMGPSWPMCGGINATAKLATMANKRIRLAEKMAKIAVLESVLPFSRNEFPFVVIQAMIDNLKDEKMDFNAMDNRKCTVCDMVFDEDCDDCPIMPSKIRSRIIQQQLQPDTQVEDLGAVEFNDGMD